MNEKKSEYNTELLLKQFLQLAKNIFKKIK